MMTKTHRVFPVFLWLALGSACGRPLAPGEVDPSAVRGTWQWPFVAQGLNLSSVISDREFTMIADCSFNGNSLRAVASAGAVVDDSTIRVLGSASRRESRNGLNCDAKVSAGTLNYTLKSPNTLELRAPGEAPLTLTRTDG